MAQDEIEHEARREVAHKMKFKLMDGIYVPTTDPEAQAGPSRRTFSDRINDYVFVHGRMMTLPQAAVYLDGLERDRLANEEEAFEGQSSGKGNDKKNEKAKTKQASKKDLKKKRDEKDGKE